MNSNLLLGLFGAVLLIGALISDAWPQDHHPLHRDFYMNWKQPGTSVSCCNARIETNGVETGDCEPTDAKLVNGRWMVWIRQLNDWLPGDDKIIRERNPTVDGTSAHVCWTRASGIMCFVPPFGGG